MEETNGTSQGNAKRVKFDMEYESVTGTNTLDRYALSTIDLHVFLLATSVHFRHLIFITRLDLKKKVLLSSRYNLKF